MKLIKTLIILPILILAFVCCKDDDEDTPTLSGKNVLELTLSYDIKVSETLTFDASDNWTVSDVNNAMFSLSKTSGGAGKNSIVVKAKNYNCTNEDAHYSFTINYGNGQGHSDDRNRRYQGEPYEYNQYNGRQYDNRPYGTGNYPEGPGGYGNDRPPQDKGSFGWAVLGFFLPLVGLILFFVWKKEKPGNAKKAGLGALIGGILCVVVLLIDAFTIGRVAKKYIAENGATTSSSTFVANASSGTEEPDVISSSVYSEKYGTTDDSAADMPAVTKMPEQQEMIDSTSMNDTEGPRYADIQAAPENGTADWKTFAFTLDGKDMSLPVAYSDLQAAGWSVDLSEYGYEDGYIMNANDAVSGRLRFVGKKNNIVFVFRNKSGIRTKNDAKQQIPQRISHRFCHIPVGIENAFPAESMSKR